LQSNDVPLTPSRVRKLLANKGRCEIICQQNELNASIDRGYARLYTDVFSALLNDFLDTDDSVVEAFNKVNAARVSSTRFSGRFSGRMDSTPNYCTPWLLVLMKEHSGLRNLLCSPNFEENLPFLMPLLQQVKERGSSASSYLPNYLSSNAAQRAMGKAALFSLWFPQEQDKEILLALQTANRRPMVHRLARMSTLMKELNKFVDVHLDRESPAEKTIFKNFRKDAMLVLLGTDTVEQKKASFEKLAYHHFAHPKYKMNILKDVLQFITLLFPLVMLGRYLCGCDSVFFYRTKSDRHAEASRALETALHNTTP